MYAQTAYTRTEMISNGLAGVISLHRARVASVEIPLHCRNRDFIICADRDLRMVHCLMHNEDLRMGIVQT